MPACFGRVQDRRSLGHFDRDVVDGKVDHGWDHRSVIVARVSHVYVRIAVARSERCSSSMVVAAFAVVAAQAALGLAHGHRLAPRLLDFVEVVPPPFDGDQVRASRAAHRTARRRDRTTVSTSCGLAPEGVVLRRSGTGRCPRPPARRPPPPRPPRTGPLTASPPAKIHFSEVWPVTGLTWMKSALRVSSDTLVADASAGRASGRWPPGPGRPG